MKNSVTCVLSAIVLLTPAARGQETVTYTYDVQGRLVATSTSGGTNNGTTSAIGLDPAGNRTSYVVSNPSSAGCSFAVLDREQSIDYTAWVNVERTGTCSGPVTISFHVTKDGSTYENPWNPSTGTVTFSTTDTYKTIPVTHYGSEGIVYVSISLASGSAAIADPEATISFV